MRMPQKKNVQLTESMLQTVRNVSEGNKEFDQTALKRQAGTKSTGDVNGVTIRTGHMCEDWILETKVYDRADCSNEERMCFIHTSWNAQCGQS
jgi:hypothetical protein